MPSLFRAFFFAAFLFVLLELFVVFEPFLGAFAWAATFTLVFYPFNTALRRRLGPDGAALACSAAVFAGVVAPLTVLGYHLARESAQLAPAARAWLDALRSGGPHPALAPALTAAWDGLDDFLSPLGLTVRGLLLHSLSAVGGGMGALAAEAARQVVLLGLGLGVLAVSLFFTFRHGQDWLAGAAELIPMARSHQRAVERTVSDTFTTVVRGVLANAVLQGLLVGVGFKAAGLRFPVLLGTAAGLASLIPFVGAALVWAPACLILLAQNSRAGMLLAAWCLAMLAVDRLAKLRWQSSRSAMPEFLLFFSILGGVEVFGLNGLLLGPLLIATALAFVRIYRQEFSAR